MQIALNVSTFQIQLRRWPEFFAPYDNYPFKIPSSAVSALQVIEQFTGLDLGWEDDPCSPKPWDHVGCEGSLVTSLYKNIMPRSL